MDNAKSIQVTEPFLPPLAEYTRYLEGVWERNWLTNNGPLLQQFEARIQSRLGLASRPYCVANGGLGLQLALRALGICGEIVTTPFSYIATASCPLWEGCTIRFADIDPEHLTLDPRAAEAAITPRTEAIVATHVYGNPCDVDALADVAARHGIAVIYDAAHAFGVDYRGRSILEHGDASMVSTHATKLIHTVEGGFVIARDPEVAVRIEWMRRFGHDGPLAYHGIGINAKMSEFHAAMGLAVLDHIDSIIERRQQVCEIYDAGIASLPEGRIRTLVWREGATRNWAYYPVLLDSDSTCDALFNELTTHQVHCRRYFSPSLDEIPALDAESHCPVSRSVSRRILSLPLSTAMTSDHSRMIAGMIKEILG